jgi:hypothetical protein
LVRPGYFISPVPSISVEHSPIRHRGGAQWETSNFSRCVYIYTYSDTSWWWAVTCPKRVVDWRNRGQTVHQVGFNCTAIFIA